MAFSLRVHEYGKVPGTSLQRIIKSNHFLRLSRLGHPPIYIQKGKLYSEGGQQIREVPAWFLEDVKKCSPEALRAVGYLDVPVASKKERKMKRKEKVQSRVRSLKPEPPEQEQPEEAAVETNDAESVTDDGND